jgi:hypothetical protein
VRRGRFGFRSGAAAWTPASLGAALKGWYVADTDVFSDAGTTPATDGQTVQQWNDQSGNGDHISQATGGDRPAFRATGINHLPGVHFEALYLATAADAVTLGGDELSVFLAIQANEIQSNGRIVSFIATGQSEDWNTVLSAVVLMGKSGTNAGPYRNGEKGSFTIDQDTPIRIGVVFDGTDCTTYLDNVGQTPVGSTGTFGATGTLGLGGRPDGGSRVSNVIVAAMIVTDSAVSLADRAKIDTYLLSKIQHVPFITTVATHHNNEGTTLAIPLTATSSLDEAVTWSITGGAQSANFELSGSLLRRASNATGTFTGSDEVVSVRATGDDTGLTSDLTITVRVGDLNAGATKDIIIVSDAGADADDMAAFGVAIKRHLDGNINILAAISSSNLDSGAGCIRATLDHYGLPGVPVGAYQGTTGGYTDVYSEEVRDEFGTPGLSRTAFVDSTTLLRQIAATATRDFDIVSIGSLSPLALFRQSAADVISASNGNTLATNSVTQLIVMAGDYPNGTNEFNMARDAASSKDVGDNWPTPVIWHGFSIGDSVTSGPPAGASGATDPIKRAYDLQGSPTRPSWDPLAVLYACDGAGSNFSMGGSDGTNTISLVGPGNNAWTSTAGNDSYVSTVASDAALGAEIDAILDALI